MLIYFNFTIILLHREITKIETINLQESCSKNKNFSKININNNKILLLLNWRENSKNLLKVITSYSNVQINLL